jgi:hypothetical protein
MLERHRGRPGNPATGGHCALILAAHLSGQDIDGANHEDLLKTPAAIEFVIQGGKAWGAAHEAAGASPERQRGAVERALAAYTQTPPPPEGE